MENLIQLQKNYDLIVELEKRINYLRNYPKLIQIKEKSRKIYNFQNKWRKKLDNSRTDLKKLEKDLQSKEETLNEIVNELYSGKINDIKILEVLKDREEKMNKEKESIENEVIEVMGKIDIYTRELNKYKHKLNLIEEKIEKLESQIEEKIRLYDKKLLEIQKNIKHIRNNIDTEILQKYDLVRKKHKNALVAVINQACSGCNLGVYLNTMDALALKGVVECENCGRLLYIEIN
ncbi:zinc ribbon domain-containing protein [Tepidibacter formicigenes]|uniref:Predicted nucleic acid-binding protein, contains Zn-ribbon domain n=1 Tax=Tepidibacter formicigenes DSM 15518 TaxID=1123349 RepID=A0A1M6PG82_9FIRM|nr:hypothetical protein [Tepidibacter formicigenes]SHK06924.1 Predicted nucleic acid-binding protein, contains Zn-ribbon domain [Tepidibacter formicigenes DSM 15518]